MASQNEASIWISSAPIAVRNTPRSRCSSAHHRRSSDLSTSVSASLIALRASEVRSARYNASAFSRQIIWHGSGLDRLPDSLLFPSRSTRCLQLCHRKRCAPNRGEWLLQAAKLQNSDVLTVQCKSDAKRSTSAGLRSKWARHAAKYSAMANACISFSSLLVRSLPPWSLGKRRSFRNATRIRPQSTDKLTAGAMTSSTGDCTAPERQI